MTAAFNLSQLANNLNTSGRLDATDGLSGVVPVANGGTGLSSPGTSGNVLISNGTAWTSSALSSYAGPTAQVFTSSGTFTVPAGITKVKVTVIGGGGGGGKGTDGASAGGGGGGAGVAIEWITGLTPGGTVSVTVGSGGAAQTNGGTSSFGSYCSATGGAAGSDSTILGDGGIGGSGSGGNINISGGDGSIGIRVGSPYVYYGGAGGGSLGYNALTAISSNFLTRVDSNSKRNIVGNGFLGGCGGYGGVTEVGATNATGYGNGGGGSVDNSNTIGTGSAGIVIVEC